MNKEELEYENRRRVIADFKSDLKTLMAKYNFGISECPNYNGTEDYCGSDYYFVVNGETWYGDTIAQILDEAMVAH